MTSLQLFHDLPPHIEAALTESIRRFAWLDDSSFRRLVDALCIRRGWPLTEVAA